MTEKIEVSEPIVMSWEDSTAWWILKPCNSPFKGLAKPKQSLTWTQGSLIDRANDPIKYVEAMKSCDEEEWKRAMEKRVNLSKLIITEAREKLGLGRRRFCATWCWNVDFLSCVVWLTTGCVWSPNKRFRKIV